MHARYSSLIVTSHRETTIHPYNQDNNNFLYYLVISLFPCQMTQFCTYVSEILSYN